MAIGHPCAPCYLLQRPRGSSASQELVTFNLLRVGHKSFPRAIAQALVLGEMGYFPSPPPTTEGRCLNNLVTIGNSGLRCLTAIVPLAIEDKHLLS